MTAYVLGQSLLFGVLPAQACVRNPWSFGRRLTTLAAAAVVTPYLFHP